MTIRRIDDGRAPWEKYAERCLNPDHNVPSMICLQPGTYEHECPGCHRKTVFTVHGTYMCADKATEPTWELVSRAPRGNAVFDVGYPILD